MSNTQIKALEAYVELLSTNATSHIVRTANQLGIIKSLRDGQKTAEEIAELCQVDQHSLGIFLDALIHTGLIENYGDQFALAQVTQLIPETLADLGDSYWKYLGSFLCTGHSIAADDDNEQTEEDFLVSEASHEWMQTPAALAAAKVLEIGVGRRGLKILELGCGSAVFSAALAHIDPTCEIVLVDSQDRLNQAQQTVNSIELGERVQFVSTDDYTKANRPSGSFQLVMIAGVLHRHDSDTVAKWLEQVARLVQDGGEICIVDVFPGLERGDKFRTYYQLELALRTRQGMIHDPLVIQENLGNVGFRNIQFAKLPVTPHLWGLILATKK